MKFKLLTWVAVAAILLAGGSVFATESVVFVDDDPANFAGTTFYVGTWTESTFFPTTYGQGYRFTRNAGYAAMRANLDIDETGGGGDNLNGSQFQAFARWSAAPNRCNSVRIEVRNSTTNTLVTASTVNQTIPTHSFNWNPVGGRFTAVPNQLYEIRVIAPGICVTTVDGGMFAQQTYDSSDVFNLTALSSIDEAGLDWDATPTTTSVGSISTCGSRTNLKVVSVTVPDSTTSSYVVCRATGRTFHLQTNKWVFYTIDDAPGTTSDVFAYTGTDSTVFPNSYDEFAMQKVYSYGSEGGTFTYYLKACRQDTSTTGTSYHDDFVCEMFPTRY